MNMKRHSGPADMVASCCMASLFMVNLVLKDWGPCYDMHLRLGPQTCRRLLLITPLRLEDQLRHNHAAVWVVVKIMVPFWVP